jgi:hypothetical protein
MEMYKWSVGAHIHKNIREKRIMNLNPLVKHIQLCLINCKMPLEVHHQIQNQVREVVFKQTWEQLCFPTSRAIK